MTGKVIAAAKSAYQYPLIIKHLWHAPLLQAADQEIVYRDSRRFTYRELRSRVGRLASALAGIGVRPGDTVGILDWDSNRFLEAFFAVPMMGAVLQTVNVRLSPEQVAYTINHAGSSLLLVNDEFVPLLQGLMPQLPNVKKLVAMSDRPVPQTGNLPFEGEYEVLLAAASPDYRFPDFDENTQATTFYTSGTRVFPKASTTVIGSWSSIACPNWPSWAWPGSTGGSPRDDVYMPMTPMFHVHAWEMPWAATLAGMKQVYPGRYDPALLVKLIKTEGVTFTHGVPTLLEMLLKAADAAEAVWWTEDDHRRLGSTRRRQTGPGNRNRRLGRLWHVRNRSDRRGRAGHDEGPWRCERELDVRVRARITAPLVEARIVGQT